MFDIGWTELLVIGIVALIVIGPKELPGVLRSVGVWVTKIRRMASEFQGQFQEAMREAEMADLKKEVDTMASQVKSYGDFNPLETVQKEFDTVQTDMERAIADKPPADYDPYSDYAHDTSATPPAVAEPSAPPGADTPPTAVAPAPEPRTADFADAEGKPEPGRAPA